MRRLIWIVGLAALAWVGWWWAASTGLHRGLDGWLADRRAEGWQAEVSAMDGGGFPLSLRATMRDLALADPDTGIAVRTQALNVTAPAWWPGDVTLVLDDRPIRIASPYGQSELTMTGGVRNLGFRYSRKTGIA